MMSCSETEQTEAEEQSLRPNETSQKLNSAIIY
jgi:hypothetical protein